MRQIIDAIRYIHNKKIIHRDLKLDNILVHFNSEQDKSNLNMMKAVIKIIDFGFATHIGSLQLCYTTLGSPINMDPNILKKMTDKQRGKDDGTKVGYDQKADIWSLGTICYEMLIGKSAFNSQSMEELVKKVESGSYSIPTNLSKEVVSFLNGMLQYNAKNRLSADELAHHQFLTKNIRDFEQIDVRKVSNKVNQNKLNVNIKRNQTIWSIFNTEDEDKLINIPGNLSPMEAPIREDYNIRRPPSPPNKRRNTEKIPHIPNPYKNLENNDDNQYEINKQRTQKFQNYGGYNGMNGYTSMDGTSYGYPNYPPPLSPPNYPPLMSPPHYPPNIPPSNYPPSMPPHYPLMSPHYPPPMSSPHFPYSMPMIIPPSIPTLGDVEPEDVRMMRKRPEGGPNEEFGYGFSSGIFQPNPPPLNRRNEYGGGYGYGYGYGYY
jgi:serine/threonine protein kinase